ncbi:MAG: putative nucleotidyltransferase [Capsulimonas sp.]|nr:putative nucleotidyltransferase [Capsulimonas sp.]
MSTVLKLTERGLVKPPKFLPNNIQYETIMGSVAYGVSNDFSNHSYVYMLQANS